MTVLAQISLFLFMVVGAVFGPRLFFERDRVLSFIEWAAAAMGGVFMGTVAWIACAGTLLMSAWLLGQFK